MDKDFTPTANRDIAESKSAVLGTKAQVLKTIMNSKLGETKCSEITSQTLISFPRDLTRRDDLISLAQYGKVRPQGGI